MNSYIEYSTRLSSEDARRLAALFPEEYKYDATGETAHTLMEDTKRRAIEYVFDLPFVSDIRDLPHRPGVYFLYDSELEEILYVGRSFDLNRRWSQHNLKGDMASGYSNVLYYDDTARQGVDQGIQEAFFILVLRPRYNHSVRLKIK